MNVLIIEDEGLSARELIQLIKAVDPGISIAATLESVEQALAWFASNPQPDLIFSDIQLTDGLSFEIYHKIDITCPIIFCTAFDEYLMNAFETTAISYLLKPITREKVAAALGKLNTLKTGLLKDPMAFPIQNLLKLLRQPYKSTILVSLREKIIPLPTKDIAYFYMEQTVVEVGTAQNRKYFMTNSLDDIEKMTDPELFFRANRQFLINRNAIENAERFFSRKLIVKLKADTPETIVVSKAKASEFLAWLANHQ
jgi:two-component system, LytTR family, response regulator LytT